MVACKTYARGLVFVTVYHEGSFYVVMQDGEGDQVLISQNLQNKLRTTV